MNLRSRHGHPIRFMYRQVEKTAMEEAASAIAGYLTDIDANGYNFCKPKWRNRQTRTTQTRVGKPVWVRLPPSAPD